MASSRMYGEITGVSVGATFANRKALNAACVHKPLVGGISGSGKECADSVVVSGGYEDDKDFGDEIIYTGHGGRDLNGKHVKDQDFLVGNLALARNEIEGVPVRLIRGADRKNSFAPVIGYRYDGLFRVEDHWHEVGKAGFLVWRFRLLKVEINESSNIPLPTNLVLQERAGYGTPVRISTTIQRIVRDTKQAKQLKQKYGFACQICGAKIVTASGPYAEAAHIRPLGEPHCGPDTVDNIICLCPNHHVMFDHGTFSISDDYSLIGIDGILHALPEHKVSISHLAYHRAHYLNQVK